MRFVVVALYKFVQLENFKALRPTLLDLMLANKVKGTLLLASEGINGTICGSRRGIDNVLQWLQADLRFNGMEVKESLSEKQTFYRTKVKLKKEIVTMGVEGIDAGKTTGIHVNPGDWNALICDPDVTVIDTRNNYEVKIGTFKNAVNPETTTFREFPDYARDNLSKEKNKKIAMFCTGGIRCEKSTSYLKAQGFEEVYQLKGGILKYLEEVPEQESLWQGECFVFDQRVAVDHALKQGRHDQCYACRMPLTEEEKQTDLYKKGISCPHCYANTSAKQQNRFAERERQIAIAHKRGRVHIGDQAD